jgi:hypothetical protein
MSCAGVLFTVVGFVGWARSNFDPAAGAAVVVGVVVLTLLAGYYRDTFWHVFLGRGGRRSGPWWI